MLGRERRQERRERRDGGGGTRYQMHQRMISIGDDYVIENDRGERAFKLDGKALRIRKTIVFRDMDAVSYTHLTLPTPTTLRAASTTWKRSSS